MEPPADDNVAENVAGPGGVINASVAVPELTAHVDTPKEAAYPVEASAAGDEVNGAGAIFLDCTRLGHPRDDNVGVDCGALTTDAALGHLGDETSPPPQELPENAESSQEATLAPDVAAAPAPAVLPPRLVLTAEEAERAARWERRLAVRATRAARRQRKDAAAAARRALQEETSLALAEAKKAHRSLSERKQQRDAELSAIARASDEFEKQVGVRIFCHTSHSSLWLT